MADAINPSHYRSHASGVEAIEICEALTFCLGNALKYAWRCGQKGPAGEDLRKAAWYLDREADRLAFGGAPCSLDDPGVRSRVARVRRETEPDTALAIVIAMFFVGGYRDIASLRQVAEMCRALAPAEVPHG